MVAALERAHGVHPLENVFKAWLKASVPRSFFIPALADDDTGKLHYHDWKKAVKRLPSVMVLSQARSSGRANQLSP